jgi:hypothetical protein
MLPSGLDEKESHARPVFRALMAFLLLAMAGVLIFGSIPLLMNPGPVEVLCPTQPRKFTCELGAAIVRSIPSGAQRTVLGATGVAATFGIVVLVWMIVWRKKE